MASVASMPSPSATCAALVGLLGSRTGTSDPSGPSHLSSVARGAWRLDMAEHGGRGRWSRRSKTMAPLGVGAIGAVVGVAGTIVVAALVTTALARGAALPAGRVFMLTLVGLVGGLATLAVARSHRVAGPGRARRSPRRRWRASPPASRSPLLDGEGGSGWAPTWAMRSGGPWCSCCCGPCPLACSAPLPGARERAVGGPASAPVWSPHPERRTSTLQLVPHATYDTRAISMPF